MEESVLLATKPLVDSIRHFIRDPTGVFSVCHLCECRIVQWRHDSRLLLLLNWFLASRLLFRIKAWRAGLRPSATKKLKSLQKSLRTRTRRRKILFLPLGHKIPIFSQPCNILYIIFISIVTDWYAMLIVWTCQWPAIISTSSSFSSCYLRAPVSDLFLRTPWCNPFNNIDHCRSGTDVIHTRGPREFCGNLWNTAY